MARPMYDLKVGDLVYPYGTPVQAAKILSIGINTVEVINVKGEITTYIRTRSLQDFNELVEDHKRKAEKFSITRDKLNSL